MCVIIYLFNKKRIQTEYNDKSLKQRRQEDYNKLLDALNNMKN